MVGSGIYGHATLSNKNTSNEDVQRITSRTRVPMLVTTLITLRIPSFLNDSKWWIVLVDYSLYMLRVIDNDR